MNWIQSERNILKSIYESCQKNGEKALSAYTVYMWRILNGFEQMELSSFYCYEKPVLTKAMKIFCKQFAEQIEKVLKLPSEKVVKKMRMISEIETSVSLLSDVYKNVVDSTVNSDRKMFTTIALESNIYDLSPKYFAFYASLLNKLIEIHGQEEDSAFLLHPTIKNNIQIEYLFPSRKENGNVVLVYLPESLIEDNRSVSVYLLHEAYHILTNKERNRKTRAMCFFCSVAYSLKKFIFHNVSFSDGSSKGNKLDVEIKDFLKKEWFSDKEFVDKLKERDDNDYVFYSRPLKIVIKKRMEERCKKIFSELTGKMFELYSEYYTGISELESGVGIINEAERKIQANILMVLKANIISKIVSKHMLMYREIYSDLSSIMTLQNIEPELYKNVFRKTIPFNIEEEYLFRDIDREIRMKVVCEVIKEDKTFPNKSMWEELDQELTNVLNTPMNDKFTDGKEIKVTGFTFSYDETILKQYKEYLDICKEELSEVLKKQCVKEYRNIINSVQLEDILSNDAIKKLDKIDVNK